MGFRREQDSVAVADEDHPPGTLGVELVAGLPGGLLDSVHHGRLVGARHHEVGLPRISDRHIGQTNPDGNRDLLLIDRDGLGGDLVAGAG